MFLEEGNVHQGQVLVMGQKGTRSGFYDTGNSSSSVGHGGGRLTTELMKPLGVRP